MCVCHDVCQHCHMVSSLIFKQTPHAPLNSYENIKSIKHNNKHPPGLRSLFCREYCLTVRSIRSHTCINTHTSACQTKNIEAGTLD